MLFERNSEMTSRIRILGIGVALVGLVFVAAGAFAFLKAQEGANTLQAYSEAQNVKLAYDANGKLGGDNPEEAAGIMALLTKDWKYPVVMSDFNAKDPLVNTASEYMYQMATINYHILTGTQTVVLTEDAKAADGTVVPAGTYQFAVDGKYYADFNRANPIEGAARGQAWSATALGLIANLGVGTTTASAIQLAMAVAGLFAAVGLLALMTGFGLIWAGRAPILVATEDRSATFVTTPGVLSAPVSPR
jgi:hypothetical protein